MDEFERVLYNNLLSGISLGGDHYHYENPLTAIDHPRWAWHDCPCCPPMILKMVGALPAYIYATDETALYVNLYIGSKAHVALNKQQYVLVEQVTNYPWKGKSIITITPSSSTPFTVKVRIPGWASGKENPFNLYYSKPIGKILIKVNQQSFQYEIENGYAVITRPWKKGDVVKINLPVEPRIITPNDSVNTIKGKLAIAAGPIVYCFEGIDNPRLNDYSISQQTPLHLQYNAGFLNGVNTISGVAKTTGNQSLNFIAIPFYATGNRNGSYPYKVWLPNDKQ
jgi:DUF1680 family protein